MNLSSLRLVVFAALVSFLAGIDTANAAPGIDIAQQPLFTTSSQPPLNMLVLGRDHKLFNAAYNDASDLNGDGTLDVGYKPSITYYGYFDSGKCYTYDAGGVFEPQSTTADKKCPGQWSGDFLNYVTTSRIDALRKVLYGGLRSTDSATQTILERAYIPQDGHVFGKEYQSVARDGYDIHDYTPYSVPANGKYLLFANETLISAVAASGTLRNPTAPPLMRVMQNSPFRIWNWVAIEGPVGGNDCFNAANARVDCLSGGGGGLWSVVPPSAFSTLTKTQFSLLPQQGNNQSSNQADMDRLFPPSNSLNGATRRLCGSGTAANIDGTGNQFKNMNGCPNNDDNYLTQFAGTLTVSVAGNYQFAVDGDDAVEVYIDGILAASWYGPHGDCGYCTTHSGTAISLSVGNHTVLYRHQEVGGGDNYRLLWLTPNAGPATRDDYTVRVEVCKSAMLEDNCEKYTNSVTSAVTYKPTGLMHDYGETDKMMFGLISGSFMHNKQGGVLRKQMGSFKDEINFDTGQFVSPKKGLVATMDGIKIQSLNSDSNPYTNPNYGYNCSAGWSSNQPDSWCRPWGNPIGEMMWETLRYFAGAGAPEPEYIYTDTGSDDKTLGMPEVATWKDPYKSRADGGGGFLQCAKPFETVVSDVNPSYDSELPGNAFGAAAPSGSVPTKLAGLDVSALGQTIWTDEGYGSKNVYIGQAGSLFDAAPTAKTATSFGNIRGLSPEEPTKQGTYYSSSVAFYGNTNDLSEAATDQKMQTFSVALSSPLPRIEFPINGHNITLVPFAKSVGGCIGVNPNDAFIPTNQIVGFYVEKIVNTPGQPTDGTINGGRPYAKFRISYEDAEQGNDYDMDAIVSYELSANADNTLSVHMVSEYAAGCAIQHMGYVISGSNSDGVYLEVRDKDTDVSIDQRFRLDTPEGYSAGQCSIAGSNDANTACPNFPSLPLDHSRTFSVGNTAPAEVLKDPLWFAAKYGGFKDTNGNGRPDPGEWDTNVPGTPDNYFLVTNALGLKAQLQKAFDAIIAAAAPTASVATSTPRFVNGSTLAYEATFNATDWSGDLNAYPIRADGVYSDSPLTWNANARMPTPVNRNILTAKPLGNGFVGTDFTAAGLTTAMQTTLMAGLDTSVYNFDDVLSYLRGDQSKEQNQTPPGPFRTRTSKIGDILNSSPAVIGVTSFGYGQLLQDVAPAAAAAYPNFVESKKAVFGTHSEDPVVFVGSNDGMLHAFDGSEGGNGGKELFAYVPNAALEHINALVQPSYVHRYFVDGSPTVSDAYLGSWKTVLLASTGAGSRSVFALDVTNPGSFTAAKVMWEFNNNSTDPEAPLMGQFIGRPWMGIDQGGAWIATFGNGYNNSNNTAVLFVRNLGDGTKAATIPIPVASQCATGEVGCGPDNGLATAVLVDNDGNGAGDTIYAGDYLGNLWRFEYVGGTWQLGNGNAPIFVARDPDGKRQSITSGVYTVANPLGGTMVIFGTGRYLDVNDADSSQIGNGSRASIDTLYGIWDSRTCTTFDSTSHACSTWSTSMPISATSPRSDLQQQTITSYTPQASDGSGGFRTATRNPVNFRPLGGTGGAMGWYLDLSYLSGTGTNVVDLMAGERVTVRPDGILSDVVINTIRPQGDSCQPGVQNATMVLDALTGAADYVPVPPAGGWPSGHAPPAGLVGTDTYQGPPQGEPPIVIIQPAPPGVPCLPGAPSCVPPPPPGAGAPTSCSWVSPNPTDHPPGKPMPCGRISWKQLR